MHVHGGAATCLRVSCFSTSLTSCIFLARSFIDFLDILCLLEIAQFLQSIRRHLEKLQNGTSIDQEDKTARWQTQVNNATNSSSTWLTSSQSRLRLRRI